MQPLVGALEFKFAVGPEESSLKAKHSLAFPHTLTLEDQVTHEACMPLNEALSLERMTRPPSNC